MADLAAFGSAAAGCRTSASRPTLQHDDLHDANVFVGDGRHRFFDWGDAVVSHPFVSLLVALRVAQQAMAVPNGDAVLSRLRDAYLDVWRDHGSLPALREQVDWRWQWDRCSGRSPGGGSSAACIRRSGPSGRAPSPGGPPSTSNRAT